VQTKQAKNCDGAAMKFWLMKSEPDVFSFDDLMARPGKTEPWDGVRNYLARNHMMAMKRGDLVLIPLEL
jgi:predicted RNA-binding protein with PUA-like domain